MDTDLLLFIDEFRHRWGKPVAISQAPGAVGRTYGNGFHNYVLHGKIKAVDVFPEGLVTKADTDRALNILKQIRKEYEILHWGVGIYPKWSGGVGLHVDVGDRDKDSGFASWSALPDENGKQQYYGWDTGYNELD